MSRSYKNKDIKKLWGKSAGLCSFEGCKINLASDTETPDAKVLGEHAHIVAHSPDGPRGDVDFPNDQIDSYENLILLCPTHHTEIDRDPRKYCVDILIEMKTSHEAFVENRLKEQMANGSIPETSVTVYS